MTMPSHARSHVTTLPTREKNVAQKTPPAREFTQAEKALIRNVHGYMPAGQLLQVLNDRLGQDAKPYTMEQLHAEIGDAAAKVPGSGQDWASLRKLLANAKSSGVLSNINLQLIEDFAVVFSLNAKQVLRLKDILLRTEED